MFWTSPLVCKDYLSWLNCLYVTELCKIENTIIESDFQKMALDLSNPNPMKNAIMTNWEQIPANDRLIFMLVCPIRIFQQELYSLD
jgi:hypothetical protein